MKSEYQIYLERQTQIENNVDDSAVQALMEFARSLPLNLRTQVLTTVAESFHINKVVATIGGYQYEGSLVDKGVFWRAIHAEHWSKEITDLFIGFFQINRGGNYIDIGANIGLTVVPVSRGGAQRCFAVEALPDTFRMLRGNLLRNGIENCTTFDVAIFNANTTVEFELSERNFGDHRVRSSRAPTSIDLYDEKQRKTVSVSAIRCDDLFRDVDLSGPLAIKCDIQGADGFLFSDGGAVLKKCNLLVVEFWPYALGRMGFSMEEMYRHFKSHFSFGDIMSADTLLPGTRLNSLSHLVGQLQAKFAGIDDPAASAQAKTAHVNVVLSKTQSPI